MENRGSKDTLDPDGHNDQGSLNSINAGKGSSDIHRNHGLTTVNGDQYGAKGHGVEKKKKGGITKRTRQSLGRFLCDSKSVMKNLRA